MIKHPVNRLSRAAAAAVAGAVFACGEARVAQAQLVYDPFAYPAASALDGQVNPIDGQSWAVLSNNAADDDIVITGGSLAYSGLSAPLGNSASFSSTGKSQRLGFDRTARAGELYYSLVLRVSDFGAMTTTPVVIAGFSDRSGPSAVPPQAVGARLYLRQSASSAPGAEKFNIGVSKNSGFDIEFAATDFSLDAPIFVVGSYQVVGSAAGTDDVARLWIDPASLGSTAAPAPSITAPVAGTDLTVSGVPSLAAFVLRQGVGVPSVQVDELRVDTAWARVTPPAGTSWTASVGGAWSQGSNWSTLAAPNAPEAFVNFDDVIGSAATIGVDAAVTLRTININAPQPYTLAAAGGSIQFSGSGGINVRAGNHSIAAPVSLAGESLVSVATGSMLELSGDFAGNGNALIKAGDGTLAMKHLRAGAADIIAGTVAVMPDGGPGGTGKVTSLAVNAGAAVDLADNDLVVDYAPGQSPIGTASGGGYDALTGLVAAGRNGGTWDGDGIRTSEADASGGLTSLGIGEASTLLGLGAGATTTWSGQVVDDSSVLIRYTYRGDANLDGFISGDDYSAIDFSSGVPGASGWVNGDFNYDGVISGDDYAAIDFNLVAQGPSLGDAAIASSAVAAVPEPSAMMIVLAAAAGALCRRRRA